MCNLFKSTIGNELTNDYSDHVRGTLCVSTAQRKHPGKIYESSHKSDNNNNNSNSSSSDGGGGGGKSR